MAVSGHHVLLPPLCTVIMAKACYESRHWFNSQGLLWTTLKHSCELMLGLLSRQSWTVLEVVTKWQCVDMSVPVRGNHGLVKYEP